MLHSLRIKAILGMAFWSLLACEDSSQNSVGTTQQGQLQTGFVLESSISAGGSSQATMPGESVKLTATVKAQQADGQAIALDQLALSWRIQDAMGHDVTVLVLSSSTGVDTVFTVPAASLSPRYLVSFTVSFEQKSAVSTHQISVTGTDNVLSQFAVQAGSNLSLLAGTETQLGAHIVAEDDNGPVSLLTGVSYQWEVRDTQGIVLEGLLSDVNSGAPVFTAPADSHSQLFTLVVTASHWRWNDGAPVSDMLEIQIQSALHVDISVAGGLVSLRVSGGGEGSTYQWIAPPGITLIDASLDEASFIAPTLPLEAVYTFVVNAITAGTVTDSRSAGVSIPSSVSDPLELIAGNQLVLSTPLGLTLHWQASDASSPLLLDESTAGQLGVGALQTEAPLLTSVFAEAVHADDARARAVFTLPIDVQPFTVTLSQHVFGDFLGAPLPDVTFSVNGVSALSASWQLPGADVVPVAVTGADLTYALSAPLFSHAGTQTAQLTIYNGPVSDGSAAVSHALTYNISGLAYVNTGDVIIPVDLAAEVDPVSWLRVQTPFESSDAPLFTLVDAHYDVKTVQGQGMVYLKSDATLHVGQRSTLTVQLAHADPLIEMHTAMVTLTVTVGAAQDGAAVPYRVKNLAELQSINSGFQSDSITTALDVDSSRTQNYLQVADIDAAASKTMNDGVGFDPIDLFSGAYDGNGFKISQLWIRRTEHHLGLFRRVWNNGAVERVFLDGVSVKGQGDLGGLISNSQNAQINENIVTGHIINTSANSPDATGGMQGLVANGHKMVSNVAVARVEGGLTTSGGLLGKTSSTPHGFSLASGYVSTSSTRAGGLIGTHEDRRVHNSFAVVDVSSDEQAGGLIGRMKYSAQLEDVYAIGKQTGDNTGGLVGYINGNQYTDGSIYDAIAPGKTLVGSKGEYSIIERSYLDPAALAELLNCTAGSITSSIFVWNDPTDSPDQGQQTCAETPAARKPHFDWDFGTASEYPVLNDRPGSHVNDALPLDVAGQRSLIDFFLQERTKTFLSGTLAEIVAPQITRQHPSNSLSYSWMLSEQLSIVASSNNTSTLRFMAPTVSDARDYVVTLAVIERSWDGLSLIRIYADNYQVIVTP